ncbi:MAG: radical protein [Mucilaginibacter sp.]|jgi:spore maturation protein CgeB|nr:radical protein [Mucilaginibacter sp.]
MKTLIIDGNYPKHFQFFYLKHDTLKLDYRQHYELLIDDHFGTNGAWNEPLSDIGYEVTEVYYNNKILQEHWRREFADDTDKFSSYKEFQIIFLQIQYYKPEVLYITNPHVFDEVVVSHIKKEFPFIKAFACYLGSPYTSRIISEYDICFTSLDRYSNDLYNAGMRAQKLPHAFNKKILDKLSINTELTLANGQYQLCFSGGMVRSNDMHITRLEYLEYLHKNVPLDIYSETFYLTLLDDIKENIQKKSAVILINSLKKIGFSNDLLSRLPLVGTATRWDKYEFRLFPASLKKSIQPPTYGMEMYEMFSRNKIIFNIHVDNAGDEAGNMRLFEATGVGACMLTDAKANLSEFFIPDEEVVVYASKEECVEKAKWLIANPGDCRAIAEAGKKRALRDHTYKNRVINFSDGIKRVLAKGK